MQFKALLKLAQQSLSVRSVILKGFGALLVLQVALLIPGWLRYESVLNKSESLFLHVTGQVGIAMILGAVVSTVVLWGAGKYFVEPIKKLTSLLRATRLKGDLEIMVLDDLETPLEYSALVDEYNLMINDQREAARQVKIKQQYLEYAAHHDTLTHLANRLLFERELRDAVTYTIEESQSLALYLIDIDNFKFFNDQYGNEIGDKMIKEHADRLSQAIRGSDVVARLDGDKFVVLQLPAEGRDSTKLVADKMLKLLSESFEYRGYTLKTTVTIGIALFSGNMKIDEGGSVIEEDLFNNATFALQEAKANGRGSFKIFNEGMRKRNIERIRLEEDIDRALEEKQFEVYYQPKINLQTGEVVGSEALVRWNHPVLGFVRPDIFIPVAEETGSIIALGEWILRTACAQTKQLHTMGYSGIQVAVNISTVQFTAGDILPMVEKALEDSDFSSEYLELEITETAVMQDPEDMISSLHDISDRGIKLAIDDFGTGYSSLAYLKKFPVDTLKIDQAFIKDISVDSSDVVIVGAIMNLGKYFGLKVVAEGVEDDSQYDFLREQGCDIAQGYHVSKPLQYSDYVAWLDAHYSDEKEEISAA